jgi:dipeptidyl aminopeptidase/acylaminoacyl peptidase
MRWRKAEACTVLLILAANANAEADRHTLTIPEVRQASKRLITVDDVMALRQIDTLSLSPDGHRFAILVRQADPAANEYRSGWFVGAIRGGALTYVGDGGQVKLNVEPNGYMGGAIEGSESRWSPDGQWIAYKLRRNGEVQLWRSRVDGGAQEQITRNKGDVREFAWSDDGQALYFRAGTPRVEQRAREEDRARQGYRYDEDINLFTDFMKPQMLRPLATDPAVWVVTKDGRQERIGDESQRAEFERAQARATGGIETSAGVVNNAAVLPVARADGALVWLVRSRAASNLLRVVATFSPTGSNAITCMAEECLGEITRVWWSESGDRVVFWRGEGINNSAQAFYAWSPATGTVSTILRAPNDSIQDCSQAADNRLICIRQTPTRPVHLAAIDLRSGAVQVLADVNPEFRNIRLGKVERFEWDTPTFPWNEPGGQLSGLYPKRAYGRIFYPPNFDPAMTYPVFIDPYGAYGFNGSVGGEHARHVYAANGFVVLNTAFPAPTDVFARLGPAADKQLYSADLDFPHLTMLAESTLRGLDVAAARGFIDERRVGIGGVSHGTFVPLYILQKHDRIAAISISSSTWGPHEYYWATRRGREWEVIDKGKVGFEDWRVKPEGKGREFWSRFDIADHVEAIEAPILMHLAAHETYGLIRLIRHLSDADKPYDTYVFPNETHLKWQPAHLHAIVNRNLDWFRFWLQDYEDSAPGKEEQYARWRTLRDLQCKNRRSVRNYCAAEN